jgi:hypothetical protein
MSSLPGSGPDRRPSLFFFVRVILGLAAIGGFCCGLAFTALALSALATGGEADVSLRTSLIVLVPSTLLLYLCVESARRDEKYNVPE